MKRSRPKSRFAMLLIFVFLFNLICIPVVSHAYPGVSLKVYTWDEGVNENNSEKPRIYIENTGTATIHNFDLYYYFNTENGKTPVLETYYLPDPKPVVSLVSLGGNEYAFKLHFTNVNLAPGSVLPNRDGYTIGIHYSDWSPLNKANDYSNTMINSYTLNNKVAIYGISPDVPSDTLYYGTPPGPATSTPTTTPIPTPTSYINYSYKVVNDWNTGATIELTISSISKVEIKGWTVNFAFPGNQTISAIWGGTFTQTGNNVSISNASYNESIPAGGKATVTFNINYSGTNKIPTTFGITSPSNKTPEVSTGEDTTINVRMPLTARVDGSVGDENMFGPVQTTWEKVSGPGDVVFGDINSQETGIKFSVPGDYEIKLTANDGQNTNSNTISIHVESVTTPEKASIYGGWDNDVIKLKWIMPQGAEYFKLKGSTVSGGPYYLIQSNIYNNECTDNYVKKDLTYYYVLESYNTNGDMTESDEIKVVPGQYVEYPSNPEQDNDNDGLNNDEELMACTDMNKTDTDGDKIDDFAEIFIDKTDPLNPDTDNDGIYDGSESKDEALKPNPFMGTAEKESSIVDSYGDTVTVKTYGNQNISISPLIIKESENCYLNYLADVYGCAFEVSSGGFPIESAEITYTLRPMEYGAYALYDYTIYYVDYDKKKLVDLNATLDLYTGELKATTTHFSPFIVSRKGLVDISNIELSFIIDESDSMGWNDPKYYRITCAQKYANYLEVDKNKAQIVTFNQTPTLSQTFTSDKTEFVNTLEGLKYHSGTTNIGDALLLAKNQYPSPAPTNAPSKICILLSDGQQNTGTDPYTILNELYSKNISVNTVALGKDTDVQLMKDIASWTLGSYSYIMDEGLSREDVDKQIQLTYERIIESINLVKNYPNPNYVPSNKVPPQLPYRADLTNDGEGKKYHTYQEIYDIMKNAAKNNPNICKLKVIGTTEEGRDIPAIEICNFSNTSKKTASLFTGLHHAREWITPEINIALMNRLIEGYKNNEQGYRNVIDASDIWIVPMVNPDGFAYTQSMEFDIDNNPIPYVPHRWGAVQVNSSGNTITYTDSLYKDRDLARFWRKDRRVVSTSQYIGADLNRNYSVHWGETGKDSGGEAISGSTDPSSDVYVGTSALSEKSTQAIDSLTNQIKFRAAINFHSFSNLVGYPYGFDSLASVKDDSTSDYDKFVSLATGMASCNGYKALPCSKTPELYPCSGTAEDFLYVNKGVFSFVIEAGSSSDGFHPAKSRVDDICSRNVNSSLYLIQEIKDKNLMTEKYKNLYGN